MSGRQKRVTVCIWGGLGNQLFSYAAARRLAIVNNAELRLDHLSGFRSDKFCRHYALHHFNISQKLVTPGEAFVSYGRISRALVRKLSRLLPFSWRPYLREEQNDFDERLVNLKLRGNVYLEGYWQSEGYFQGVQQQIREDLKMISPISPDTVAMSRHIEQAEAIGVHVRRLQIDHPLEPDYYFRAVEYMKARIGRPHFFVFSDCPDWAEENLRFDTPATFVTQEPGDDSGCMDLWLMSLCKHFIIANSTFSWWGAWLGINPNKIVTSPFFLKNWGHVGLLPDNWVLL
ncbi:MAG: alpha-1,2-fucosyltransferase [Planctomycetota bacterium]